MDPIRQWLEEFKAGRLSADEVAERLRDLPFQNLGFAHIDHHRPIRQGFPEVIFCPGKDKDQILQIAGSILEKGSPLLATRAEPDVYDHLKNTLSVSYNKAGRVIYTAPEKMAEDLKDALLIVTAGTSDIPVAEEAFQTAWMLGVEAKKIYDVGVAGIHRLLSYRAELEKARVLIVIAGMEGALPSVVGGLVGAPVIAVPTSSGYGASFSGITPLLSMLTSCANGITVVNIDNGYGAAVAAGKILFQGKTPNDK